MKFYSFKDIAAAGDCARFATKTWGCEVRSGRCAAKWRSGTNPDSVAIDKVQWFDHGSKTGGGIIELAAILFGGDKQRAQEHLGELYSLTPKIIPGKQPIQHSRYDRLIELGYKEVGRYEYKDVDGNVVHFVARLEKEGEKKEFCQGTPAGWGGLSAVTTILYNLKAVSESDWVIVVEGEKKCQALIDLGLPATTCCGGASKWDDSYSDSLAGKSVAILPDNDVPGQDHARVVSESLRGKALMVKIVPTSTEPKGDVADWLRDRSEMPKDVLREALVDLITKAPAVSYKTTPKPQDTEAVAAAKAANSVPFRNFTQADKDPEDAGKRRRGGDENPQIARKLSDLIKDAHVRFLGFPKKIGDSSMFDQERATGQIVWISSPNQLFSWMSLRGNTQVIWAEGSSFVTKGEFLSGLQFEAERFESVSLVPDYPMRSDVFYAHPPLPPACPQRSRFEGLVNQFSPASVGDRTMLKAFLCAPLWYRPGIPKPSWVIDSEDGPGTGKSTIVEAAALLYQGDPIRTNRQELFRGVQELIKRLVSNSGRSARLVLVDNVAGTFSSPELADLITAPSVSGRSPYGHGEETRPNNLVYVITANTATIDNDLSDRSYFIAVKRPAFSPRWKENLMRYIDTHRYEIIADIIDMMKAPEREFKPETRFPEFESQILMPVCADEEEYRAAIAHLKESRSQSNIEEEHATLFDDAIRDGMIATGCHPDDHTVFIASPVLEFWLSDYYDKGTMRGGIVQYLRNLSKMGFLPMCCSKTRRWPHHGTDRISGVLWNSGRSKSVRKLVMKGKREVEARFA